MCVSAATGGRTFVRRRAPRLAAVSACVVILLAWTAHAEQFDRTVPVVRGTRFDLRLFGGQITVRAWDKDAVRVRATHFRTDTVELRHEGLAVVVRARARLGTPHAIDFTIDLPEWMAVKLAGTYLDISVEGTRAEVVAQTVRGDVRVKGGAGTVSLSSVEGEVVLEGARARAELSSSNNGIRVSAFEGNLLAQTVSGSVKLRAVAASRMDVSTVSGDISWDGTMKPDGRVQLATHEGDVDVSLAETANATLFVRAFEGHLQSTFPVEWPDQAARRRGFSLTFGAGAARIELETFRGTVSLRRPE